MKKNIPIIVACFFALILIALVFSLGGNKTYYKKKKHIEIDTTDILPSQKNLEEQKQPEPVEQKQDLPQQVSQTELKTEQPSQPSIEQSQTQSSSSKIILQTLNSSNQPIGGCLVELYNNFDILIPKFMQSLQSMYTDNSGKCELSVREHGTYIIKVSKDQFSLFLRKVNIKTNYEQINIAALMTEGKSVKGKVQNKKGEALKNVSIGPLLLLSGGEEPQIIFPEFTKTDENGNFIFNALKEQPYKIQIAVQGYQIYVAKTEPPFADLNITLTEGGSKAKGIVAGAKDGLPQKDIGLLLIGNEFSIFTKSGQDGSFEFGGLPQGKYYIEPISSDKRIGSPTAFECDGANVVENLVIKINQNISVSGMVVLAKEKTPVAGISLELTMEGAAKNSMSDENGKFVFNDVSIKKSATIKIISPDYVCLKEGGIITNEYPIYDYMPESDLNELTIELERRYQIKGIIEGAGSLNVEKYKIKIGQTDINVKQEPLWIKPESNGKFSAERIGSGNYAASLMNENGYLISEPVEFRLFPDEPVPFIKLKLTEPMVVMGIVLDHVGKPLADCKVFSKGKVGMGQAVTDNSGNFVIKSFEKKIKLQITSDKYSQKLMKDISLPNEDEITFQFTMGNIFSGTVVNTRNEPVSSASISYKWTSKGNQMNSTVKTDDEGKFFITDVDSDSISYLNCEGISITEKGEKISGRIEISNIKLPQENYVITLTAASSVTVKIIDSDNQKYSGNISLETKIFNPQTNSYQKDRTKQLKVEQGEIKLTSIPKGRYLFDVRTDDGRAGTSEPFELSDNSPFAMVTIRLSAEDFIYGYVYNKNTNEALNEVNVTISGTKSDGSNVKYVFTTIEKGFFEIKGIRDGNYNISFNKAGFSSYAQNISINEGRINIDMPLNIYLEPASSSLKGVILSPEQIPEPSVKITLNKIGEMESGEGMLLSSVSDDKGNFQLENVNAGDYILNAAKENLFYLDRVIIKEGEAKQIKIILSKKVLVKGYVKVQDTKLLEQPLVFVNTFAQTSETVHLDNSGYFEIGLNAGTWTVNLGETNLSKQIKIPSNKNEYEIELNF